MWVGIMQQKDIGINLHLILNHTVYCVSDLQYAVPR